MHVLRRLSVFFLIVALLKVAPSNSRGSYSRLKYTTNRLFRTEHVGVQRSYSRHDYERECLISHANYPSYFLTSISFVFSIYPREREARLIKYESNFKFDWKPFDIGFKRPDILTVKEANWILTPTKSSAYYIRNSKYGEYLYVGIIPSKPIYTYISNGDHEMSDAFLWRFAKLNDGRYEIWNVKYNQRN